MSRFPSAYSASTTITEKMCGIRPKKPPGPRQELCIHCKPSEDVKYPLPLLLPLPLANLQVLRLLLLLPPLPLPPLSHPNPLLFLRLEQRPLHEELNRNSIDGVARRIRQRRRGERRSPGSSHVTDRDCRLLRSWTPPPAALAVVCPRGASCVSGPAHFGAEWCWAAARAILTLSCSWRQAALKRLSLLRFAAEEVPSRSYSKARPLAIHKNHPRSATCE